MPEDVARRALWSYQRVKRGYSDCDVWGMNDFLLDIIIPMLKHLKANLKGHPVDLTMKRWSAIIDIMISGFEAKKELFELTYTDTIPRDEWVAYSKEQERKFNEGMKYFTKYFNNLWD